MQAGHPRRHPELSETAIERRTQEIGRRIFELRRRQRAGLRALTRERLDEAAMERVMDDEELRYRLLRFVDVYPALRGADQIANHFEQYLGGRDGGGSLAAMLARLAYVVGGTHLLSRYPLAWASRLAIQSVASRFIAGRTPEAVAPQLAGMIREGFLFSIDLLGEKVVSEREADAFAARYLAMIENLGTRLEPPLGPAARLAGPVVNISIKLSSLAARFDPLDREGTAAAVLGRVVPLLEAARAAGAFVNVDMEHYELRDLTLDLIRRLLAVETLRGWDGLGMVTQSYLRDAAPALESMLAWLRAHDQPLTVRLVKGAYWDSELIWARQRGWPVPVWTLKRDSDAAFEHLSRRLLEERALVRPAFASHNVRSLAHALALAEGLEAAPDRFELQVLYGMAGPLARTLTGLGHPVRIYVPCGEPIAGMAYLVRRILENTSNESFLRQSSRIEDEAQLLRSPRNPNQATRHEKLV